MTCCRLAARLAPGAALLSPRGKVLENGMPRFFRRLAGGRVRRGRCRHRANELADFIGERARQRIDRRADRGRLFQWRQYRGGLLLLRPEALAGAILLRAMVPLPNPPKADLAGKPVLHAVRAPGSDRAGRQCRATRRDPESRRRRCRSSRAAGGHGLTQADLTIAKDWLATHTPSLRKDLTHATHRTSIISPPSPPTRRGNRNFYTRTCSACGSSRRP